MLQLPPTLSSICDFTLECLDRIVLTAVPQGIEYPQAYINHLRFIGIDPIHHTDWAQGHRDSLVQYLTAMTSGAKLTIIKSHTIGRKDDYVKALLENNGYKEGLICVIGSMERCKTYYFAKTKKVRMLPIYFSSNKCMFYYVYFYHHDLGIVQLRLQSYAPFYCQIIINGHRILERMLIQQGIRHSRRDNAFETIDDPCKAQDLADSITSDYIETRIRPLIFKAFPTLKTIGLPLRITIRQVEFSMDIVTRTVSFTEMMPAIISRLSIFNPDDISRMLYYVPNAKNHASLKKYETEYGSCIRFSAAESSLKLYDKGPRILRTETTCNNIASMKGYRTIVHKDGTKEKKVGRLSKHISSLETFVSLARLSNRRFIERLGTIIATVYSMDRVDAVSERVVVNNRSIKGFSFYNTADRAVVIAVANPAYDIQGFSRRMLLTRLPLLSPYQASYALKRLHAHGLTKKIAHTHRYHLTKEGRSVLSAMQIINKELVLPTMAA